MRLARLHKPLGSVLLIAGLCGGTPAIAAKPQPLTVVMVDDRFIPDTVEFRAGVPYRLRLENRGKTLHEFTAPEFFAASKIDNRRSLDNSGKEVVVQPQQTREVVLTPLRAGTFSLICADHDWDGMVGRIVVR
jgi:uncharacterized cupredoxin-like copper-binding protein